VTRIMGEIWLERASNSFLDGFFFLPPRRVDLSKMRSPRLLLLLTSRLSRLLSSLIKDLLLPLRLPALFRPAAGVHKEFCMLSSDIGLPSGMSLPILVLLVDRRGIENRDDLLMLSSLMGFLRSKENRDDLVMPSKSLDLVRRKEGNRDLLSSDMPLPRRENMDRLSSDMGVVPPRRVLMLMRTSISLLLVLRGKLKRDFDSSDIGFFRDNIEKRDLDSSDMGLSLPPAALRRAGRLGALSFPSSSSPRIRVWTWVSTSEPILE